ncbi:hypothetical protein F4802DRAFT_440022 [Xylaria palmicola]|nr:hypothetical protein F4802DRAFT_440022 [Xylaria palmicola]
MSTVDSEQRRPTTRKAFLRLVGPWQAGMVCSCVWLRASSHATDQRGGEKPTDDGPVSVGETRFPTTVDRALTVSIRLSVWTTHLDCGECREGIDAVRRAHTRRGTVRRRLHAHYWRPSTRIAHRGRDQLALAPFTPSLPRRRHLFIANQHLAHSLAHRSAPVVLHVCVVGICQALEPMFMLCFCLSAGCPILDSYPDMSFLFPTRS